MNWWVKIITARPLCIYYFGPFESKNNAVLAQPSYIKDLAKEGATEINIQIKWCMPKNLTTFFEDELAKSCECEIFQIRKQPMTLKSCSYACKER